MVVVYHWHSGAYVSSLTGNEFDKLYSDLCAQFGPPAMALCEDRS